MNSDADMGRRAFLRTSAGAAAATAAAASAGTAAAQSEVDYGGWFDDVSNFDGTEDATGQDTVTVEVGTQGNNGAFAFSPAAVRVDPGTTVVFEWTGEGGQHNVVEDGGDYSSDLIQEAGVHYAVQFESEGISKYLCQPHESLGMKGAVAVGSAEGDATGTAVEPPATTEAPGGGGEGGEGSEGGGEGEGEEGGEFSITDLAQGPMGLALLALVMALFSPVVFAVVLSLVYRQNEE